MSLTAKTAEPPGCPSSSRSIRKHPLHFSTICARVSSSDLQAHVTADMGKVIMSGTQKVRKVAMRQRLTPMYLHYPVRKASGMPGIVNYSENSVFQILRGDCDGTGRG